MSKKNEKLESLYNFLLQNGFEHPVSELAKGVQVTPMTLYNRYQTREKLEKEAINFWHHQFRERVIKKIQFANNAIEILLFVIDEFINTRDNEKYFFEKEKASNGFHLEYDENSFIKMIEPVLIRGIEENHFNRDIIPPLYAKFFIFNVIYFILLEQKPNVDYIFLLISSILTAEGKKAFDMINLNKFFYS